MTTRTPSTLDAALQAEYYHLQKTIEDFDGRVLTIKTWSVSFGFVALAGAFASKGALVFLIAAGASAVFWLLEAFWKVFQLGYYERVHQIESHFRGELPLDTAHQISATWQEWWEMQSWWILAKVAVWVHVAVPHALVLATGVLCFFGVSFSSSN